MFCTGVESDRMDFAGVSLNGKDSTKCIVGGISLHDNRSIRNPMCEDRSGGEEIGRAHV